MGREGPYAERMGRWGGWGAPPTLCYQFQVFGVGVVRVCAAAISARTVATSMRSLLIRLQRGPVLWCAARRLSSVSGPPSARGRRWSAVSAPGCPHIQQMPLSRRRTVATMRRQGLEPPRLWLGI